MPGRPQTERGLINHEWRINQLVDAVKRLEQNRRIAGGGFGSGGESGGGAWAAAAAVTAGSSASLTVYEVRTAGDVDKGEQTVHNRFADDTDAAGGPLILVKNPDGSYLIVAQGCTPAE